VAVPVVAMMATLAKPCSTIASAASGAAWIKVECAYGGIGLALNPKLGPVLPDRPR
jgi:hypothetical protein